MNSPSQASSCASLSNGVYYITTNGQTVLTTCTSGVGIPNYIINAGTPIGYFLLDRCDAQSKKMLDDKP